MPVVWLCDQEAVSQFIRGNPPENARLKRWWVFLTQFRLNIFHIPGARNEFCDLLSRESFNEKFQVDIENLAKEAFQRMDLQLDLRLEVLDALGEFSKEDYLPDFQELWDKLEAGKVQPVEQKMFFRNEKNIFVEKNVSFRQRKWTKPSNGVTKSTVIEVPSARCGSSEEFPRLIPNEETSARNFESHCTMPGMRRSQAQHPGGPRVGRGSAYSLHGQ